MGALVRDSESPELVVRQAYRRAFSAAPAILEYAQEENIDPIVMDGRPGNPPQFGWDDDGQPGTTGGIVMDPGWDPSWGVPVRGTGLDQHHYVLEITPDSLRRPAPDPLEARLDFLSLRVTSSRWSSTSG